MATDTVQVAATKNSLKNVIVQRQEPFSCTTLIHIALTKKNKYMNILFHAIAMRATAIQISIQKDTICSAKKNSRYFPGALLQDFKETQDCQRQKLLTDVNIPVPLSRIVTFFGYHFPILVTILVPWFMTAALFVAFVVVLLAVPLLGAVPGLSVSVFTDPMGLVSVIMIPVRIIVVTMLMWVVLLWLYISWISAVLCFWVKSFLPVQASGATAMVVVLAGGRAVLGFLDGLDPCFLLNVRPAALRDRMVIPLVSLRSLLPEPAVRSRGTHWKTSPNIKVN